MRRHLAPLALLCLCVGLLAACGDDEGDDSSSAAAEPASSAAPAPSSEAAPASEEATTEASSEASSEAASEPASSEEAPASSEEPASSEAAASTFGVGLELGDTIGTAEVSSSEGPWLVWNKETCAYEEAADHPEAYEANLRAVTGGPTQIGYMHYGDVDPFGVANSKSMADTAEKAGFQLNTYNLKFPSESEPLAQARNSVLKKDAGVVQAQQVASVSDAFLKILQTEGCIPSVQMYLKTKMVPAFGAVWPDVGTAQGTWLAEQALAKGWTPDDTALLQCTDPSLGEDVNSMFPAAVQALKDGGFAIADDDVFPIKCEFTPQKAQVPVTDWLTAHPDYKHILMTTIDDERMSGMTNAMRKAGKKQGESYLGIASGTDELGQKEIKNGHESASIAFFPEKYGEWLIPILEDVMAGNPVPSFTGQGLPVVTAENIGEYYP
jgi:ribose transport system substrate-binding protein